MMMTLFPVNIINDLDNQIRHLKNVTKLQSYKVTKIQIGVWASGRKK